MGGLDHIIAGHLHNIGAPIELLRLNFEKIGTVKGIAISFDKTAARVAGNRGIPPAELPAGNARRRYANVPDVPQGY